MVQDFGMKYKKVKDISYTSNDDKNLILRQQFAKTFIEMNLPGKVIINIEESWVNMTDFRRRKWTFPNVANSVPKKMVQPRLSLILALDTNGKIFFSLS